MKFEVKSNYLIFPVNTLSVNKRLIIKSEGMKDYPLNIKLDHINPDFYAYIDVSKFKGKTVEMTVTPEIELTFRESDEMDIEGLYSEPMRPQIHFSTRNGWINDPNGLVYHNGKYHMFYQHNPTESNWNNMHWGHTVSEDLIHWHEEKPALFPDERGVMYSGSAIVDEHNLLGKNEGDNKAAVLIYTTTTPFCQNISYSTDNFKTVIEHPLNPVVPNIEGRNRDPKVVYCDELGCYIMVIYIMDDIYCILKSDNLTSWQELQRINAQGDNECPDIFPITDDKGNRKWVFMGARDRYIVGNFLNGKFEPEQPIMPLHYGCSAYAGQTFSGLPNGRVVRMTWEKWFLPIPSFNGQMSIPKELTLSEYNGIYYLHANPVRELECIHKETKSLENIKVSSDNEFCAELEDAPYVVSFKAPAQSSGKLECEVFGRIVSFDFSKNEIKIGDSIAPVSITHGGLDITLVLDRCSIELFADGGRIYMSCLTKMTYLDRNLPYIKFRSDSNIKLDSLKTTSLESIWK